MWYQRSAEQGDTDAQAMLGYSYLQGQGTKQNSETGLQWLRKSANAGSAEAQYILGLLYQNGRWIETDATEAKNWFQRAAAVGYTRAQAPRQSMTKPPPAHRHATPRPNADNITL